MILRKSITAKFIAAVFVVLLTGQILGTALFVLNMRASLLDSLETRMRRISAIVAGASAAPLLSYDYSQMDTYLEEIVKDQEISSVTVRDSNGNVVREKISAVEINEESINSFRLKRKQIMKADVAPSGEKIGEVAIEYSAFKINEDIFENLFVVALYQFVLLLLVVFVMMLLFRRNIKNPVLSINTAIEKITSGDFSTLVPDLGENEIGGIAKGVKLLEGRLSMMIAKMSSTAVSVSMAIKQVEHTYKNVIGGITTQSNEVREVIRSISNASKSQAEISDSTEKLSSFSAENVSSLLEMKATSDEIALNVQRLFKASEESYSVALQMNQAAKAIAENFGRTSSAIEDTLASVEEVGMSVREVEDHAAKSSRLAEKVHEITSEVGMMSVVNAVEGMDVISVEVRKSAEIIQRLGIRSGDIEKVLSVIKDVTEQTNLLSLNAAILAAQAGEYGKSFSVVADEIRGLSERTSSSTKEIGGIVKNIQSDIRDAVYTIDSSQKKVEEGNDLVIKVGEALRDILNASVQSTQMTKAIERATEEQSLGLRQINHAIDDIRKMMSNVAKSTKEQDNDLGHMLEGAGEVKEVAELSKRGAVEQADGIRMITRNLELADDRINRINEAILSQKKLNSGIIEAMDRISRTGGVTVRDMEDVTVSLKTLIHEIETLKQDMEVFKLK